ATKISWAGTVCAQWHTRHHNGSRNAPRLRSLFSGVLIVASTNFLVTGHRYASMTPPIPYVSKYHRLGEIRQFWNAAGALVVCGFFFFFVLPRSVPPARLVPPPCSRTCAAAGACPPPCRWQGSRHPRTLRAAGRVE